MNARKTFLITGASSGLGRAMAHAAIAAGHRVVGTVRHEADRAALEALDPERANAWLLDVTEFTEIDTAVAHIEHRYGTIDVLVNAAGYGHEGILEESPLQEMRRQFDVNLFGTVAMIKAVLPHMRKRRHGHIINITSMAGYVGLAGIAYYTASKFALEGLTEALAKEVAHLGIKVTSVAPGSFRTDWAGRSMIRSPRTIEEYDALFSPIRRARQAKSGRQKGDPAAAASAMLALTEMETPPVHLLLGNDAIDLVVPALQARMAEIQAQAALSRSTDFT